MDAKKILKAVQFAAEKHRFQKRKNKDQSPYILHPLEVANFLVEVGKIEDEVVIIAALLHDTIEDTDTRPEEIEDLFGKEVLSVVLEVTDDKSLSKEERKRLQVERAAQKSIRASQVKIADKISNIFSVIYDPPFTWTLERRIDYLTWSNDVVQGLSPTNLALESMFKKLYTEGMEKLASLQISNL